MRAPIKFKIIFAKEIDLSLQQQAIKLTDRELSKSKTEAERPEKTLVQRRQKRE